eukprot:4107614-Alexandrium_andersonii.AAC.1
MSRPDALAVLLQSCDSLLDVNAFAHAFRFHQHPMWLRLRMWTQDKGKSMRAIADMMYALDPEAQFHTVRAAKRKRQQCKAERDKHARAFQRQTQGTQQRAQLSEASLMEHSRSHHLSMVLEPGRMYSLPASASTFPSLASHIGPPSLPPASSRTEGLALDVDDVGSSSAGNAQ